MSYLNVVSRAQRKTQNTRAPLGGVYIPVDKLALLAPYIASASTILAATAATAICTKRAKRRKDKR